jgi:hypothetical protein
VPNSNDITFSAAGTYYWQAVYSGDANNNGATSVCTSEQVVIGKNSPSISTTLSGTSVSIGAQVHDSAKLSGATAGAGGTVAYTVFSDSGCSQGARSAGQVTVTNGTVPDSSPLTLNAAGTYYWQAVYSGDGNNSGATSVCTSEQVVVGKNNPTIGTTLSATSAAIGSPVHDSATLSGQTSDAGGTVTYTVYSDSGCSQNPQNAGTKTVTGGVVPDSDPVSFSAAGTYYWQAVYSGDNNNGGATSACQSEVLSVARKSPSIATTLSTSATSIGSPVHDSATLTGATSNAGGTVTYTVYSDSGCSQGARSAGQAAVTNGSVDNSNDITFSAAGTYYWQAVYSGDGNNNGATSVCTSEQVVVGKNSPSIGTTLSTASTSIGTPVHDSATLTGATSDAGGTVTYTAFSDSGCSQDARSAGQVTVTNGSVPDSGPLTFSAAGTYYWQASYTGDSNNEPATSDCTSEVLTVAKNSPLISTTLSSTSASIGSPVHDSASLSGKTSNAGGTVTYTVYSDQACSQNARDAGTKPVTNGVVTASNALSFTAAGTYYWQAVYSGDANNNGATSACTSEVLQVTKNTPSIATTLSASSASIGTPVHDSAGLTGATGDAGGTVTYTVYGDGACTKNPRDAGTVTVTNGSVPDSNPLTFTAAGTYYWQAVYSGDNNNEHAASACQSEVLTVTKNRPSVSTGQRLTPNDSATFTGLTSDAGGTVTFDLFAPSDATCSGSPAYTATVNVSSNGTYATSNTSFVASTAGTWRWRVTYSGDDNNEATTSACGVENFTLTNG